MSSIAPARLAAAEVLGRIEMEKAYSSILLPKFEESLKPRDRALCHNLVLGVLRRRIWLDRAIGFLSGRPIDKFDRVVVDSLRIGLYQLYYLDKIPAYSAINDSVNLVRRGGKSSAAGLVNAVLRRSAREDRPTFAFTDDRERVSVETSHPAWLIDRWAAQFGFEEAAAIAAANNDEPRLSFRFTARFHRRNAGERDEIVRLLGKLGTEPSGIVDGCLLAVSAHPELTALADSGDIYFQDPASQLVARCLAVRPGQKFLDVCSAPGGKVTAAAAEIAKARAAAGIAKSGTESPTRELLAAGELYSKRASILRENCVRQGAENVEVVRLDAEDVLPFAPSAFDVVLVDAPCSGTGTIRHNPELRYFVRESDFADLAEKQLRILKNASKMVKRGGRLIYSTCSLEREENEAVASEFVSDHPDFFVRPSELGSPVAGSGGFARTFPHRDGTDGFFIAEFRRRGESD